MASEVVRAVIGHVWSALEPLGCPCALMGGIALAVWNYPRATRDIDLLIAVEAGDVHSLGERLRASGCRPKHSPPLVAVGTYHFVQFLFTPPGEFYDVQVDLLLAESKLQKSAIERRVRRDVPGVDRSIDILNCDDLILLKLVAGRMIDLADAAMLLRENRDVIDFPYVSSWLARLELSPQFVAIWREAFPDEDPPPTLVR